MLIAFNKPFNVLCQFTGSAGKRTLADFVTVKNVYPAGRLDYDSEGLLLLTNDGDLAARLTHPRHGVERTYEARVAGTPDDEALTRLRKGIPLDGHRTQPATVVLVGCGRQMILQSVSTPIEQSLT